MEDAPRYGATLSLAAKLRLKIHMVAYRFSLPLDLIANYAGTVTSANMSIIFSFSLHHELNNRLELFANLAFFNLANLAATPHSFGKNNAHYKSHTLGVELASTSGIRFSLGVSDSSSMIEVEVTLMSATERDAGGTFQYDVKRYQRSHSRNSYKICLFSCPQAFH